MFVLISKAPEVFLEQELDGVDSPRLIHRLFGRSKLKGCLSFHIELQRGKSSWCFEEWKGLHAGGEIDAGGYPATTIWIPRSSNFLFSPSLMFSVITVSI